MGYSNDLRLRAVNYFVEHKLQYREVSSLFQIGVATLYDWVKRFKSTGSLARKKPTGRPSLLPAEENAKFKDFIMSNPDKSISELAEGWGLAHGKHMSTSSFSRNIKRIGLSYKKNFSRM